MKDEAVARQVADEYRKAPLRAADRTMLDYALKLTREPGAVTEADVTALREAGFTDRAILAIAVVTAYYAYANRIAQGLGVPLEEFWDETKL